MHKPSWLPLVMPRPELFREPGKMPSVVDASTPHLLEMQRVSRSQFGIKRTRRLKSLEPPRTMPVAPTGTKDNDWWREASRRAEHPNLATLFISLPIFTCVRIFQRGVLNYGHHFTEQETKSSFLATSSTDFEIIITRSFLTWTTGSLSSEPLYRTDRMIWEGQVPRPAFSEWSSPVPAQVIVPIEHPHLSSHRQLELKSKFAEDLQFLSICKGWGKPRPQVAIDMPKSFDDA